MAEAETLTPCLKTTTIQRLIFFKLEGKKREQRRTSINVERIFIIQVIIKKKISK